MEVALTTMGTPSARAARASTRSPSKHARPESPMGAMPKGKR